jgi:hypothetical protein
VKCLRVFGWMFDTPTMYMKNVMKPPPRTNFFCSSVCKSSRNRFLTSHDAENCEFTWQSALVLDCDVVEIQLPLLQTSTGHRRSQLAHSLSLNEINSTETNELFDSLQCQQSLNEEKRLLRVCDEWKLIERDLIKRKIINFDA